MLSVSLFSSSSEDDDMDNIRELVAKRRQRRKQSNIFSLPNGTVNKEAFKYILNIIDPKLRRQQRSTSVPNIIKLAATMRILAEGSYQKGAGNDFNVNLCQTSVSKYFKDCIDVMYEYICPKWISMQMDELEKREIKEHFYEKYGFPGVIGCIDGSHIKILAPNKEERFKYYNRKGFYSLNATIVCDHKLKIRYISPFNPGSTHDSLAWKTCDLRQFLKRNFENGEKNTWLLGDAGYPLEPFLITPFRIAEEGSAEGRFNRIHSKTRNIVERTIGILKNRFRCILGARQLHYSPQFAGKITAVCAALHNICLDYKIALPEPNLQHECTETHIIESSDDMTALNIRLKIMESVTN